MLASSVQGILQRLEPEHFVLDIGGWYRPFSRADAVMDIMPYETRGEGGSDGPEGERFTAATWIRRDICSRDPYPFADKQVDFVVCSHTLEDVRDPIWVCSEMVRVAKAGYIEVPSRLEEQAYGIQGPWAGWGHHRWLIDVVDERIEFVFKHHVIHNRATDRFCAGFRNALGPERLVQSLWWDGSFDYEERVFTSAAELDPYLSDYVELHRHDVALPTPPSPLHRLVTRVRQSLRS